MGRTLRVGGLQLASYIEEDSDVSVTTTSIRLYLPYGTGKKRKCSCEEDFKFQIAGGLASRECASTYIQYDITISIISTMPEYDDS